MIILADNDLVHKLACCDLLSEFLQWLEVPPNEIWVLSSLKYVLKRKIIGNKSALNALNNFLDKTKEIPAVPVDCLEQFSSFDIGEQQLFGLFVSNKQIL